MAKLELALLVGAESKEWLAGLEAVVGRLEKALSKSGGALEKAEASFDADTEETTDDDDFTPARKSAKKAVDSFDEDEDEVEAKATDEDEEEFEAPTKKKAKKLTLEDVNDACKKRAAQVGGKEGRTEVLGILKKKFKTTSVSELKPEQFASVIAAMT